MPRLIALIVTLVVVTLSTSIVTAQNGLADPEGTCGVFREGITNCTSLADGCTDCKDPSTFMLDSNYDIKSQNGGSSSCASKPAGPYCFQVQSWISCCPDCKEPFDEFADCVLDTGRVIDTNECTAICTSGGVGVGVPARLLFGGMVAASSLIFLF